MLEIGPPHPMPGGPAPRGTDMDRFRGFVAITIVIAAVVTTIAWIGFLGWAAWHLLA